MILTVISFVLMSLGAAQVFKYAYIGAVALNTYRIKRHVQKIEGAANQIYFLIGVMENRKRRWESLRFFFSVIGFRSVAAFIQGRIDHLDSAIKGAKVVASLAEKAEESKKQAETGTLDFSHLFSTSTVQ